MDRGYDMHLTHGRRDNQSLVFCSAHPHIALHELGAFGSGKKDVMSIKSLVSWIDAWRRYRTAVSELSQLSERELSELGLSRDDIQGVARRSSGL
jgi:uncharacterized protein YjiS (DUF1127 family)